MRTLILAASLVALAGPPAALAQKKMKKEADFVKARPAVGDTIPDLTVYDPAGNEMKTSSLRGHFVVLTFGCLT